MIDRPTKGEISEGVLSFEKKKFIQSIQSVCCPVIGKSRVIKQIHFLALYAFVGSIFLGTSCYKGSATDVPEWTLISLPSLFLSRTRVYGQFGSFNSADANNGGVSADSLNNPWDAYQFGSTVYIVDRFNNRVLAYEGRSTTATRVYGQFGSFTSTVANNGGRSQESLNEPLAVAADSTGVYICDIGNHRVLFYPGTTTIATRVYGQTDFTSGIANNGGVSATSLRGPYGIALDSSGVYIADRLNSRVLFFSGTSILASRVYGQFGFYNTAIDNNGGVSEDSMSAPYRVALGSNGVYIADRDNNRVMFYPGSSTTATRVYGQLGSFTSNTENKGGISAQSLRFPVGITVQGNNLYVSEAGNNRVLLFQNSSTIANGLIGQDDFSSGSANHSGVGLNTLSGPTGIYQGNGLFIADRGNNRVLFLPSTP